MDLVKRLNKRGAIETNTMLVLIVGIIAAVSIILFFTKGFGFFTNIFEKSNIDITLISQKCSALASVGGSGYCTDKIEIGKDSYVNCPYAVNNLGAVLDKPYSGGDCTDSKKKICTRLGLEEGNNFKPTKVKVNGIYS